ncbi:MAG: hypothetical protein N4A43_03335 [Alphaproteobacteria bacterium]|jgi:hypothetical protein|nr:hypothetical protein [Alphaproteobacteria bacterium]
MEKENIIKIVKYKPELFPQFKMLQKKLSQYERDITNEHCPYTLTDKVTEDILEKMMQDSIDFYKNNNYKPWATTFIKRIK